MRYHLFQLIESYLIFVKYYLLTLVGYAVIDPRVERQRIYLGTKIVSASFMPWHEFRGM